MRPGDQREQRVRMPSIRILACAIGIAMMATAQGTAAQSAGAGEIDRLLRLGRHREAYELALRRAAKEAGNPDFDFAFARAAIAEKQFDQAIFALERVVMSEPD